MVLWRGGAARGPAWTRELRLRPLPQVFTIDALRLLVDQLRDLLAIRLPFLAKVSFQLLVSRPAEDDEDEDRVELTLYFLKLAPWIVRPAPKTLGVAGRCGRGVPLLSLKLGAFFLQSVRSVCPTRWKQLSVLGVLLGYSWCLSGRKKCVPRFIPPIHTRFIPRFIPFCCHLQPRASCALGSTSEAMPPKSSEDTRLKEKHCRNQLAALFAEVRQKVGSEGLLRCIKRDTVHHL